MSVARCRVIGEEIVMAGPGHSSSSPDLRGEVLEILGPPGRELLRIRWGNGTETVLPQHAAGTPARPRPSRGGGTESPASRRPFRSSHWDFIG